jgi:DNA-binding CsgD family transcriptional regulator
MSDKGKRRNGLRLWALHSHHRRRSHGSEGLSLEKTSETECDVMVLDFLDARWLPINLRSKASNCPEPKLLLISRASVSEVLAAVRSTFGGAAVCPAERCAHLFQHIRQSAKRRPARPMIKRPDLTFRQQQLVCLVAKGLTNKEIASRLNISEYAMKNHLGRIMKRVDAENRSQAVEAIRSHGYSLNSYGGTA